MIIIAKNYVLLTKILRLEKLIFFFVAFELMKKDHPTTIYLILPKSFRFKLDVCLDTFVDTLELVTVVVAKKWDTSTVSR